MHQAGFTNAVASLGTALTSGHASLVKRYTQEVLLLYDSDEAGVKGRPSSHSHSTGSRREFQSGEIRPHKDPDEFIKSRRRRGF